MRHGIKLNFKPDLLIAADLHLRETPPVCRADKDFMETQRSKLQFLSNLQKKYNSRVVYVGDISNSQRCSIAFLNWIFKYLPAGIAIAGQHDLPRHSLRLLDRSTLGVLIAGGKIRLLVPPSNWVDLRGENSGELIRIVGFNWNDELRECKPHYSIDNHIAIVHKLITKKKEKFFESEKASHAIRQLKGFDLIISGDNHQPFEQSNLINVGCFIRQRASEASYAPRVIAWSPGHIQAVPVPHDPDAITREHIEIAEEKDQRLEAFIHRIRKTKNTSPNFKENIRKGLPAVKNKRVKQKIKEATDV